VPAIALLVVSLATNSAPPLVAGRDVPPPKKLKDVVPVFPEVARNASPPLEGLILLQVTLDEGGRPIDIVVRKGIPLLDGVAIEAVREWRYAPTLVDGKQRQVLLKTVVEFFLSAASRNAHLIDLVGSAEEDVGLRLYAIQALASNPVNRMAVKAVLQKAVGDKNELIAGAASRALAADRGER